MSLLSIVLPTIGVPDSSEDPKIVTAFSTIQTWANGNIDTTNLSSSAGITPGQLVNGDSGWQTLTLINGYAALAGYTPQYRRFGNTVLLRGTLGSLSGITTGTEAFAMPAGFRPAIGLVAPSWPLAIQGSVSYQAACQITSSTGSAAIFFTSGAANVALDAVHFTVD